MAYLTDVIVDELSFVDRAAVRNPDDPDEPQRYLFWKSERGRPTDGPTYQLKDLVVDRISFVDRAAVRDPEDPTQPQRFLFWKSERPTPAPSTSTTIEPVMPGPRTRSEWAAAATSWAEELEDEVLSQQLLTSPLNVLIEAYRSAMTRGGKTVTQKYEELRPPRSAHEVWEEIEGAELRGDAHGVRAGLAERPDLEEKHRVLVQKRATGAVEEAEKRAERLRKSERWLTKDQALAEIYESDPELFARAVAYDVPLVAERPAAWRSPRTELPEHAVEAAAVAIRKALEERPAYPGEARYEGTVALFNAMSQAELAQFNGAGQQSDLGQGAVHEAIVKAERLARG